MHLCENLLATEMPEKRDLSRICQELCDELERKDQREVQRVQVGRAAGAGDDIIA